MAEPDELIGRGAREPAAEADADRLVAEARAGREESFAELVEIFAPRLQAMIYRMILDWDETRDVAQETFVSAYQALSKYRAEGKFQSWLFRIGARRALDAIRRRKHHPEERIARSQEGAEAGAETGTRDKTVSSRELTAAIEQAVAELPAEQRTAFVLAEYEGATQAEIAETLGVSVKSVEMHLYRARATLREKLRAYL